MPATPAPDRPPPDPGAERAEILAALDELLEAERAGARVALETGRELAAGDLAGLVAQVHHDEVRWCGLLMRSIEALGAAPSSRTGAFHGKAMAIAGIDERLQFLNRGQAWVVRKLQALIPRIDDATVRAGLDAMLLAHQHNIALVEAHFAAAAGDPGDRVDQSDPSDPPPGLRG